MTSKLLIGLFALGLVAPATAPAMAAPTAASPAPVRSGRQIAETVCAECHQITANAPAPPPGHAGPSFRTIADAPSTSRRSLLQFMAHTEWNRHTEPMTMPLMLLLPQERRGLADYILSQRSATAH